jgi:hypothetical protein
MKKYASDAKPVDIKVARHMKGKFALDVVVCMAKNLIKNVVQR